MRYAVILIGCVIAGLAVTGGGGPELMRSIMHGFGWGIGREVAHSVVHHVLR